MILRKKPIKAQFSWTTSTPPELPLATPYIGLHESEQERILRERKKAGARQKIANDIKRKRESSERPAVANSFAYYVTAPINSLVDAGEEIVEGLLPFSDKNVMVVGPAQYGKNIWNALGGAKYYSAATGANKEWHENNNEFINNLLTGVTAELGGELVLGAAPKLIPKRIYDEALQPGLRAIERTNPSKKFTANLIKPPATKSVFSNLSTDEQVALINSLVDKYLEKALSLKNTNKIKNIELLKRMHGYSKADFDIIIDDLSNKGNRTIGLATRVLPDIDTEKLITEVDYLAQINNISFTDAITMARTKLYNEAVKDSKGLIKLSDTNIKTLEDLYNVLSHELKHDITMGDTLLDQKTKDAIASVFKNNSDVPFKYNKPNYLKDGRTEYEYLTTPTEFQAYLGTNLRDQLKNAGYINDVLDDLPLDILDKVNIKKIPVLERYLPLIADKRKLIKIINMTPYVGAGAALIPLTNQK